MTHALSLSCLRFVGARNRQAVPGRELKRSRLERTRNQLANSSLAKCVTFVLRLGSMKKVRTAAERYFAERMLDPEYRREYEAASVRIRTTDVIVRSLDARRQAEGLTKAELARRAHLPAEAVRRLFSADRANPTLGTITALAGALNVELVLQPLASKAR